jgi:integrase
MYEFAIEREYEGVNPCRGIKKHTEHKRDRFLRKEELLVFFDVVMNDTHPIIRDFVLVCLCTGARSGNVQAMRWEEIDWDNSVWHIPITKSGKPHTVPLVPFAIDVLKKRRENVGGEWVFPSLTIDSHILEPKVQWHRICKQAGINDLRIHDLRRTLGSWMAQTGSTMLIISGALGHKIDSSSVTGIYARLDIEPIRMAMERAVKAMLINGGVIKADVIPFGKVLGTKENA